MTRDRTWTEQEFDILLRVVQAALGRMKVYRVDWSQ